MTPPSQAPPPGTNGLATAALICGIIGLCFVPLAIAAIIMGFVARNQVRQTRQQGDGMAMAGLVLGFVSVALTVIGLFFWMSLFRAF